MSDTTRTPPTLADLRARRDEILARADENGVQHAVAVIQSYLN